MKLSDFSPASFPDCRPNPRREQLWRLTSGYIPGLLDSMLSSSREVSHMNATAHFKSAPLCMTYRWYCSKWPRFHLSPACCRRPCLQRTELTDSGFPQSLRHLFGFSFLFQNSGQTCDVLSTAKVTQPLPWLPEEINLGCLSSCAQIQYDGPEAGSFDCSIDNENQFWEETTDRDSVPPFRQQPRESRYKHPSQHLCHWVPHFSFPKKSISNFFVAL